jgi:UDP-N-acetylmuramoylalanine--D-glutamate ligase
LLLPITPDHLNWHGSKEEYEADKLKPLTLMQEGELALIPKGLTIPDTNAWVVEYESVEDIAKFFDIDISKIKFKGAFLLDSILALAVQKALFEEANYEKINSFKLDAHRQEEIIDSKGRLWINDSKATNVDAAFQAIKGFSDRKIHLILGGDDKGVDLNEFFDYIKDFDLIIYAIGSNTNKLIDLSKKYNIPFKECHTLEHALKAIDKNLQRDEYALLSPAAASLDQFNSYAHRGDTFKDFVKSI